MNTLIAVDKTCAQGINLNEKVHCYTRSTQTQKHINVHSHTHTHTQWNTFALSYSIRLLDRLSQTCFKKQLEETFLQNIMGQMEGWEGNKQ